MCAHKTPIIYKLFAVKSYYLLIIFANVRGHSAVEFCILLKQQDRLPLAEKMI